MMEVRLLLPLHMTYEQQEEPENKEKGFAGKTFFIAGAAQGIGRAILLEAAREGAFVHGVDLQPTSLSEAESRLVGTSAIVFHTADIREKAELERIANGIDEAAQSIDYLILSAGVTQSKSGWEIGADEQEYLYDVNVEGARTVLKVNRKFLSPQATVVIISSDLITQPPGDLPHYADTKRELALEGLAVAESDSDIRVLIALPGPIDTSLFRHNKSDERIQIISEKVGLYKPEEFAHQMLTTIIPDTEKYPSGSLIRMYKSHQPEVVTPDAILPIPQEQ